jgi:adenosylcobinamide kinase/adenosylcobinamide-phosphate guanylyltransferase
MAGKIMFVIGGARSGKSRFAQSFVEANFKRPLYLATAEGLDSEMRDRIRNHRRQRGSKWRCVEEPLAIERVLLNPPACDGILIDCLTLWASNVLCQKGEKAFEPAQKRLISALRRRKKDIIIVSNEVGMGIVPETELGRKFRDLAGWLNQKIAQEADTVVLVTAGLPLVLKGKI